MKKQDSTIVYFIIIMSVLGIISISMYSTTTQSIFKWISFSIFLALSSFIFGSLIGFLFGIPKVNLKYNENNKKEFIANTSLEQIADWLTKIIIGVGLTQLITIPKNLSALANNIISGVFDTSVPYERNTTFVICILIFYSILGFFFAYFYARLTLINKFVDAETFEGVNSRLEEKVENEKNLINDNKIKIGNILTKNQKNILKQIITAESKVYVPPERIFKYNDYIELEELIKLNVLEKTSNNKYKLTEEYLNLTIEELT